MRHDPVAHEIVGAEDGHVVDVLFARGVARGDGLPAPGGCNDHAGSEVLDFHPGRAILLAIKQAVCGVQRSTARILFAAPSDDWLIPVQLRVKRRCSSHLNNGFHGRFFMAFFAPEFVRRFVGR